MNFKRHAKLLGTVLASVSLVGGLLLTGCTPERSSETALPASTSPAAPQETEPPADPSPVPPSATAQNGMLATPQPANSTDANCTYSTYYWLNNPNRWLTDNILIGNAVYTKSDALELMSSDTQESTAWVLKEFLAAALNILKGADPGEVERDMASASDWLNAHPPGFEISVSENQQGIELAVKLQAYNGGILGPGACEDEPPTPTPTATLTPTITPTATRTPILPSETPRATATERIQFDPQPTSPPASQPAATEKPVEPTAQPATKEPPPPTSAPTEAPPPPEPGPTSEAPPPQPEPVEPPPAEG